MNPCTVSFCFQATTVVNAYFGGSAVGYGWTLLRLFETIKDDDTVLVIA